MDKKKLKNSKKATNDLFKKDVPKDEERNEKVKQIGKKKRKREGGINLDISKTVKISKVEKMIEADGENKKNKLKKKERNKDGKRDLIGKSITVGTEDKDNLDEQRAKQTIKAERETKKNKPRNKKRKTEEKNIDRIGKRDPLRTDDKKRFNEQHEQMTKAEGGNSKNKPKKKRKNAAKNIALISKSDPLKTEDEDDFDEKHDDGAADHSQNKAQGDAESFIGRSEALTKTETINRKSKRSKKKKKEHDASKETGNIPENKEEAVMDDVYHISSGEEDCSKGMKKWLAEYHQSRPGLKVLQQRIDEFIISHEEKLDQEKKERESRIAEEGWTVVAHHKGRKKTTDSESGTTVVSVAPVVAENQLAKKKQNEVGLNFYRFQKRETQRNEILALQSKFEQDKKRIQQLRAARKFKPY
ncbi:uncharacterized protein LOC126677506 isoform X2 [Mercurialis annua]|uniref:uncharacterized protein LOC126677506 isoform X2 n=1 Tax=Mercurialis annua TaxID=3986 RepID=UPI00215FB87E|nr:uncharacterized protein LOC126677506 isoform X2 [Mercurialis annua]